MTTDLCLKTWYSLEKVGKHKQKIMRKGRGIVTILIPVDKYTQFKKNMSQEMMKAETRRVDRLTTWR